jgi:hypothetical protein
MYGNKLWTTPMSAHTMTLLVNTPSLYDQQVISLQTKLLVVLGYDRTTSTGLWEHVTIFLWKPIVTKCCNPPSIWPEISVLIHKRLPLLPILGRRIQFTTSSQTLCNIYSNVIPSNKVFWDLFFIYLTVHLRKILVDNQLDAQFLLWYVYLNPLHVSSNSVLILRRTIVLIQHLV